MMIMEFRAARASWNLWHDHPATETEQRLYGRRWRWTRLWETIWDRWVDQQYVRSLTEFIKMTEQFWHPLLAHLEDVGPYDPAVEIVWEEALTAGPEQLAIWPQLVRDSWAAMILPQPVVAPTIPAEIETPSISSVDAQAEAPKDEPAEAPNQHRLSDSQGIDQPGHPYRARGTQPVVTGHPETDAILMDWYEYLRDQGFSISRARTLRRLVAKAINATGLPLADLPGHPWDRETDLAVVRMHQWLEAVRHEQPVEP